MSTDYLDELVHTLFKQSVKYRTEPNNLNHPEWGSSETPLKRLTDPIYLDGKSEMIDRISARVVSNTLFSEKKDNVNDKSISNWLTFWGQLIDHDLDLSKDTGEDSYIEIPTGDPFFDPNSEGGKTMTLHRSNYTEESGVREQITSISAYMDASNVYGSDDDTLKALREGDSAFLKTSLGDLLPLNDGSIQMNGGSRAEFMAGDIRANEHLGLLSLHTVLVRFHNLLAQKIIDHQLHRLKNFKECFEDDYSGVKIHLNDDDIFKLTRTVVEAIIQSITYNRFLPKLLGEYSPGAYYGYDPEVDSTIMTEFSTAAYRFGHTMVSSDVKRFDECDQEIEHGHLKLRDNFFTSDKLLNEGGLDPIIRGHAKTKANQPGLSFIDDLRNFLFGKPGQGGFDLCSLNIQRGRDHGLGSINDCRQAMSLQPYDNFDYVQDLETRQKLIDLYGTPDQADLFPACMAETPEGGSLLGPTFSTIIKLQFENVRNGDRFWYQNHFDEHMVELVDQFGLETIFKYTTNVVLDDAFTV